MPCVGEEAETVVYEMLACSENIFISLFSCCILLTWQPALKKEYFGRDKGIITNKKKSGKYFIRMYYYKNNVLLPSCEEQRASEPLTVIHSRERVDFGNWL